MAPRILIIEDNEANLDLMVYLLNHFGYVTLTAQDGEEGLALVYQEKPDLIICDMQLPKLNGYEISEKLRNDPKIAHIPLIAVTAYSMVGDKDKIISSGFDDYLSKPIDPEKFASQINACLKRYRNRFPPKPQDNEEG